MEKKRSRTRVRRLDVYVIRNVQTGAVYIGASQNAKHRFKQHLGEVRDKPGCPRISREAALGMTFELTVINRCEFFDALLQEKREIANARLAGLVVYNRTDGGDYPMTRAEAALFRRREAKGGKVPTSASIRSKRMNELRKKMKEQKPPTNLPKVSPIPMCQRPFEVDPGEDRS